MQKVRFNAKRFCIYCCSPRTNCPRPLNDLNAIDSRANAPAPALASTQGVRVTISWMMSRLSGFDWAATNERMEKQRKASLMESVAFCGIFPTRERQRIRPALAVSIQVDPAD